MELLTSGWRLRGRGQGRGQGRSQRTSLGAPDDEGELLWFFFQVEKLVFPQLHQFQQRLIAGRSNSPEGIFRASPGFRVGNTGLLPLPWFIQPV